MNADMLTDLVFSFAGQASAPLTQGEPWQPKAPGEMRVLVDGRRVAAGRCVH